jgi:rhodanese-related sulfurtransferase
VFGMNAARRTATGHCAGLMLATALQQAPADARISQAEFKQLFTTKAVVVVDTRAEPEYARAHVPGAISLGDADMSAGAPAARQAIDRLRKSKRPVVVYCACPAEITSLRVAEALRAVGINDVRALTGGWVEWFNAGNPVEPSR